MPLNKGVNFKAKAEKKNRFQISKLIRWEYKLEPTQLLKVTVSIIGLAGVREIFLTNMRKDGRITIPFIAAALLKKSAQFLEGRAIEVILEPAQTK